MEYLMLGEFWREVGLTVAARLSVVAAALWAVKMVTDHLTGLSVAGLPAARAPRPAPRKNPRVPTAAPERTGALSSPGGAARRLSVIKSQSDSRRTTMGKYLSGEPAVTTKAPRAASVR